VGRGATPLDLAITAEASYPDRSSVVAMKYIPQSILPRSLPYPTRLTPPSGPVFTASRLRNA
jgi:hypothetical protein